MKGTDSLPNSLMRLWYHLHRRRRRQFVLLLGLMLASAFAEVISLGAVLPFLGILTSPERVFNQPVVASVAQALNITSADQLVLPLTLAFIVAALMAGALRLLLLWASTRLSFAAGSDISVEAYRRTLYQPFRVHMAYNSSEVINTIIYKVGRTVDVLRMVLTLISSIVLMVFIVFTLIAIDPVVSTVAALGFGISYGLITWFSRHQMKSISRMIALESTQVIKVLQEGLGGIRDVLLDELQSIYCDTYRKSDMGLRRAQGNNQIIALSPRAVMEAIGIVLIAALAYGLSLQAGGITPALPVLAALAIGAQRLLPVMQQSYAAWTTIVGCQDLLSDVLKTLELDLPAEAFQPLPKPLMFQKSICFDAVRFRYTAESPWVLDGFDLYIQKGSRVGIVGSTGGGKTTALDLMIGLLEPTQGQILVDGQTISGERCRAWKQSIAHVPQSVYLSDKTIVENIAFGVPPEAIDMDQARKAAQQAQLACFIESQKDGYQTIVGERGMRLSGGQRQRIGIARALYKKASVLVFDEATSALDNVTEQAAMDAIDSLDRELTIFLIAHRLTTLKKCDIIVVLENGRVVAQGNYEQLLVSSPVFRQMAHDVREPAKGVEKEGTGMHGDEALQ